MKALGSTHPFDIEAAKARLGDKGGYEVVHESDGIEIGVYVLVAPEPDRQQPHADDEVYVVLDGHGTLEVEGTTGGAPPRQRSLRGRGRGPSLHGIRGAERSRRLRQGEEVTGAPLSQSELELVDAYWRAANYLSVGQIYLLDNPLLRAPLEPEHIKPRLLGHFGTTPGLNFVYAHLNRAIKARDLSMIYITGPGHGGPGLVANAYLEGTYSELYPRVSEDLEGLRVLCRQFSFPGGIPSHVAPETPGSIHEGGELGYALSHAFGAAFDNPDLVVACVVGDGEAETGPLATSWHSNKFLDPRNDGAVLPILHLNGYKIANPTVLARIPEHELRAFFEGLRLAPVVRQQRTGRASRRRASPFRSGSRRSARRDPRDPAVCARRPRRRAPALADDRAADTEGLDGPARGRRHPGRGNLALASSPGGRRARRRRPPRRSSRRGCGATGRRSSSTSTAGSCPSCARSRRVGERRMSANPHANGGVLLQELSLPDFRDVRSRRAEAGHDVQRGDPRSRRLPARRDRPQPDELPSVRTGRDRVEPAR